MLAFMGGLPLQGVDLVWFMCGLTYASSVCAFMWALGGPLSGISVNLRCAPQVWTIGEG